jgi:hypothetical protein
MADYSTETRYTVIITRGDTEDPGRVKYEITEWDFRVAFQKALLMAIQNNSDIPVWYLFSCARRLKKLLKTSHVGCYGSHAWSVHALVRHRTVEIG